MSGDFLAVLFLCLSIVIFILFKLTERSLQTKEREKLKEQYKEGGIHEY